MLYYDRVNFSQGIDDNKTSKSKECDVCYYQYFLIKFKSLNLKQMSATDTMTY